MKVGLLIHFESEHGKEYELEGFVQELQRLKYELANELSVEFSSEPNFTSSYPFEKFSKRLAATIAATSAFSFLVGITPIKAMDTLPIQQEQNELESSSSVESIKEERLTSQDDMNSSDFLGIQNETPESARDVVKKLSHSINESHPDSIPAILELEKQLRQEDQTATMFFPEKYRGVEYVVAYLVETWNGGMQNASGYVGDAIHLAAKHHFNLDISYIKNEDMGPYHKHAPTIGLILDLMKQHTLQKLQDKGIHSVTLYRGVALKEELKKGSTNHKLSPLSSFTTSRKIAEEMAYSRASEPNYHPYLSVKTISIDRVLSTGHTGFGALSQAELVVLGPQSEIDEFEIIPLPKPTEETTLENENE